MYLAIDTSSDNASLAIVVENRVVAELTWLSQHNHSVELMPNLNQLIEQTKTNLGSTTGIVVAIGPGSFNGLRVGVSTAKGLAFSMGIPLVGINTLEAAAYQYAESGLPICPIFNAGSNEIATAIYHKKDNQWLRIVNQHITTVDVLGSKLDNKTIICGEPSIPIQDQLKEMLGERAIIPSLSSRLRRAAFLAELGIKRMETGDYDAPDILQPIYLRQPPITQPKHPMHTMKTEQEGKG